MYVFVFVCMYVHVYVEVYMVHVWGNMCILLLLESRMEEKNLPDCKQCASGPNLLDQFKKNIKD